MYLEVTGHYCLGFKMSNWGHKVHFPVYLVNCNLECYEASYSCSLGLFRPEDVTFLPLFQFQVL